MDDKELGIKIDPDRYYTYEDVEILLGIGEKTMRERVSEGRVTVCTPARTANFIKGKNLIKFLDENDIHDRKR